MIHVFGKYGISWAISANNGGSAAFLTSSAGLNDYRSGSGCSMSFNSATAALGNFTRLTATLTNDLGDATAVQGAVGVVNVQGLPAGTKVVVNGTTQRLVAGARGELSAWFLPQIASNTLTVDFYQDVNGSITGITSGQTFAVGEVYVGRAVSLPTLLDSQYPSTTRFDPNAYQRMAGLQLYQLLRKSARQFAGAVGRFNVLQAKGGVSGTLYNGNLSNGTMDLEYLRDYLTTAPICAVCDVPYAGFSGSQGGGSGVLVNGIHYDQNIMQTNFMLARMTDAGSIAMDAPPLYSWNPQYQEAI